MYSLPRASVVADVLVITMRYLVEYGFLVVYGSTQVAEIPLVVHLSDDLFGRKLRKDTLVLAGKVSVASSLFLGVCECPRLP